MKVRKAVIIAAGKGTRFLPVTRSVPKEMLPVVDRPLIHYAVEEAIDSGIEHIIMVTAQGKSSMEDYFDRCVELECFLEEKGDNEKLDRMSRLSNMADIWSIRQKEQKGLGHAVLTAKDIVGNEPFAVILPDDIIDSTVPTLKRMMDIYEQYETGLVAVERIGDEDTRRYGVVETEPVAPRVYRVQKLMEKPEPEETASRLGIVGRYIFTPEIFDMIISTPPGAVNEIQITDAMQLLLGEQEFHAFELEGIRHDTGTPFGWLKANIAYALKRDDIEQDLREYLRQLF
jgi:UTP--glucose-1-phosphate uridylyltransferase